MVDINFSCQTAYAANPLVSNPFNLVDARVATDISSPLAAAIAAVKPVVPQASDFGFATWSGSPQAITSGTALVAATNYMVRVHNPGTAITKVLLGLDTLGVDGSTAGSGFYVWVTDGTGAVLGAKAADGWATL